MLIPRDEPTLDDELVFLPQQTARVQTEHASLPGAGPRSPVLSAVRVPSMWRALSVPETVNHLPRCKPLDAGKLSAILAGKSSALSARLQRLKWREFLSSRSQHVPKERLGNPLLCLHSFRFRNIATSHFNYMAVFEVVPPKVPNTFND